MIAYIQASKIVRPFLALYGPEKLSRALVQFCSFCIIVTTYPFARESHRLFSQLVDVFNCNSPVPVCVANMNRLGQMVSNDNPQFLINCANGAQYSAIGSRIWHQCMRRAITFHRDHTMKLVSVA